METQGCRLFCPIDRSSHETKAAEEHGVREVSVTCGHDLHLRAASLPETRLHKEVRSVYDLMRQ